MARGDKKYKLWKGRRVKVFDSFKEYVGIGRYIGSQSLEYGGLGKCWTPRFRVGSKIYYGYECWWIPLSEARKAEGEILCRSCIHTSVKR